MTIHSKRCIFSFSAILFFLIFVSAYCANAFRSPVCGILTFVFTGCLLFLLIGNTLCVDGHELINTARPHSARVVKDSNGKFQLEIVQFPWIYREANTYYANNEEGTETEYRKILEEDTTQMKLKQEAGVVKILASPKRADKSPESAFEHIEAILMQYAPEKVEAIKKIKEIFEK